MSHQKQLGLSAVHGSIALIALSVMSACAATPDPVRVRFADAATVAPQIDWRRGVILEVQKGDRIPVQVSFSDDAFALVPSAPPLALVAQRHCFLRLSHDGIKRSFVGRDFDEKPSAPGTFQIHLPITPTGTHLEIVVQTPKRPLMGAATERAPK